MNNLLKTSLKIGVAAGFCFAMAACQKSPAQRVYFGNLTDGAEIQSPFIVQMKAENLIVEPASMGVQEGHGHFHILIDAPAPAAKAVIPKDEQHIHYGQGQSEDTLHLSQGEHTLSLVFAKGDHIPYEPAIEQTVRIKVTNVEVPAAIPADTIQSNPDSASTAKMDTALKPKSP